jgi:hypothetical protein
MTSAIPALGKILASRATSGVSVGSTATQTLMHLTKGVHARPSPAANQPKFAEMLNKTLVTAAAHTTRSPGSLEPN